MSDIFGSIVKGIGAIAPTVANLVLPGSGNMLAGLMRAVTGDGEYIPIEKVAARIQADPKLMLELERVAMEREVGLAKVEAAKLETVNLTMRAESVSEHWQQYSWRPYNGFLFGTTMFVAVTMTVAAPFFDKPPPDLGSITMMMAAWATVLGVQVLGRNKEKSARAGAAPGLFEGVINAIRK